MTPYDLFAAYLKHRLVEDISKHIPGELSDVDISDNRYTNIPLRGTRKAKVWIKNNDLADIETRMRIPYGMWHNTQARCLCMVATFRPEVDIIELLYRAGKWRISSNDIAYYNKLFWNITDFTDIDWRGYLSELEGLDFEVLKDLLGDTPVEAILHKLGVHQMPNSYQDMLSRMAARAWQEFETSQDKAAREWGKFALNVIDKLKDADSGGDIKSLIKELEIELTIPDVAHSLMGGDEFL
jgi:hypothetical protein